jgi:hypothetical protein
MSGDTGVPFTPPKQRARRISVIEPDRAAARSTAAVSEEPM